MLPTASSAVTSLNVNKCTSTVSQNALYVGSEYVILEPLYCSLVTQSGLRTTFAESVFTRNTLIRSKEFSRMKLSKDARTIMTLPNAGGQSEHSEALSCDVLGTMFGARLIATEMELKYWPANSKITDFSVSIRGEVFGVSVTRAMKFRGLFTEEDALRLLTKKLQGVNASTKAVLKRFRWQKQILHVWAQHKYIAQVLEKVYESLSQEVRHNTLVVVTVCENAPWVFYQRENFGA